MLNNSPYEYGITTYLPPILNHHTYPKAQVYCFCSSMPQWNQIKIFQCFDRKKRNATVLYLTSASTLLKRY